MAHIIIFRDGIAYYPGHEPGEGEEPGGGREAHQLPEITEWVELPAETEKIFQKAIDKALKK